MFDHLREGLKKLTFVGGGGCVNKKNCFQIAILSHFSPFETVFFSGDYIKGGLGGEIYYPETISWGPKKSEKKLYFIIRHRRGENKIFF